MLDYILPKIFDDKIYPGYIGTLYIILKLNRVCFILSVKIIGLPGLQSTFFITGYCHAEFQTKKVIEGRVCICRS